MLEGNRSGLLAAAILLAIAVAAPGQAAPTHKAAPVSTPPGEADWRTPDPDNVLVIDTNHGRIFVELSPATAPQSVARLKALTRTGFYDGRAFFRVIDEFMDQTGDPLDNGTGGSLQPNLAPEFNFRRGSDLPFVAATKAGAMDAGLSGVMPVISQPMALGALTADNRVNAYVTFCPGVGGIARADDPASGNSQFFLMRGSHDNLDMKYTAFGRVIAGMDVVKAIKVGEPPAPPADKMTQVRVLADIPAAERPKVRVADTQGAWFQAQIARMRADRVADFSLCDIDLPSEVK